MIVLADMTEKDSDELPDDTLVWVPDAEGGGVWLFWKWVKASKEMLERLRDEEE